MANFCVPSCPPFPARGIVPKLFWPINAKKRAKTYDALSVRTNSMVADYLKNPGMPQ